MLTADADCRANKAYESAADTYLFLPYFPISSVVEISHPMLVLCFILVAASVAGPEMSAMPVCWFKIVKYKTA